MMREFGLMLAWVFSIPQPVEYPLFNDRAIGNLVSVYDLESSYPACDDSVSENEIVAVKENACWRYGKISLKRHGAQVALVSVAYNNRIADRALPLKQLRKLLH